MRLPIQKIPDSEKNEVFSTETIDALIDIAVSNVTNKSDLEKYYRVAAGILDEAEYNYFLNPYNTQVDRLKRFQRKLRNYDIITPILKRFIGEYIKTAFDVIVTCENADTLNKFTEQLSEKVTGILRQKVINDLNAMGVSTGVPTQETPDIKEMVANEKANWIDDRAILGQEAVEYFKGNLNLDEKFIEAVYHWFVTDEVYSYRGVYMDDLKYDIIHPLEAFPIANSETMVEDMDGFVRVFALTPNQVVNEFRGRDTDLDKILTRIESDNDAITATAPVNTTVTLRADESFDNVTSTGDVTKLQSNKLINVYHVQYLAFKRIKKLTYINELGDETTIEVSDDYKIDKANGDIKASYDWVNAVSEGWRIGEHGNAIYIKLKYTDVQRNMLNNKSKVKLNYNGTIGTFKYGGNISLAKLLAPYQALTNIFHANLEELINKNMHKLVLIPKGLIPEDDDMDIEDFFYYMKADGKMIVDESVDGFALAIQAIKTLDLSLGQTIKEMIELIRYTKEEAWDVVEMNRQRYGESYASDGKATTEEAIYRSSIGSLPQVHAFENFKLKDIAALLDYSKFAWIDSNPKTSKGSYITSDKRIAYFSVDPKVYCEAEFGIHPIIDPKEEEAINIIKGNIQPMLQNGQELLAIELIQSKNMAQVKDIVKRYTAIRQQMQQAAQEAEAAATNAANQLELQKAGINAEAKKYEADSLYKGIIDGKMIDMERDKIKIDAGVTGKDGDGDGIIEEQGKKYATDKSNSAVVDKLNRRINELQDKNKELLTNRKTNNQ